jgi:acetyl esterase/lipase
MLDDRNIYPPEPSSTSSTDADLAPFVTWSCDDNWTGWNALLGSKAGSQDVSPYAAPARAENLSNLPETYIDVGTLDIFAKEDQLFAERLREAGVRVEWHLYQGVPHGFEFRGRQARIVSKAYENRRAAVRNAVLGKET